MPKSKQVSVRMHDGTPTMVDATIIGEFAVHKSVLLPGRIWTRLHGWTVTHVPTGLAVKSFIPRSSRDIVSGLKAWIRVAASRDSGFLAGITSKDDTAATDALRPHRALFSRLVLDRSACRLNAPLPAMDAVR